MWFLFALAAALGSMQGQNVCDRAFAVYDVCIGERVHVPFCGPVVSDTSAHTIAVDGVAVPVVGPLVRYGYNVYGQHLEAPGDVGLNGLAFYTTSTPIVFTASGQHVITIVYGPAKTSVTVRMNGATAVKSIVDGTTVTMCRASAAR